MIRKALLLLLCFTSLFLVSCKKNKKPYLQQHLRLNIVSEPQSLDPRKVRDLNAVNLAKIFFEGLMRKTKDNKVEYALAESFVSSEDGKTYTFILKDSYWSNNDKLTSYDFEYTWKKTLSPTFLSSNASSLFIIKNAKQAKEGKISAEEIEIYTPDEKTLIVELEKPCPYFLKLLTCPVFFPVNSKVDMQNSSWAAEDSDFICNGPFKLNKWKHQDFIEAQKNSTYWQSDDVKLDKITMMMLMPDVELNMFEMGQLDVLGSPFSSIIVDSLQRLKKQKNFYIKPYYGTAFLRINTTKVSDKKFRNALIHSFDRQKIVDHILQGGQIGTTRLVPTNGKKDIQILKNNLSDESISITYVNGDKAHLLAQALQRDFEENLNIKVELRALERKTYYDKLAALDYDIAICSWIADFDDPIDFLNVFKYKDNSTNNTGWESQKYVALLEQSEKTLDENERKNMLLEAENLLLDEAPIIPIYHLTQNFMKNENLKDVYIYPSGFINLRYAHFE